MTSVIVVWVIDSVQGFERHVPLKFICDRNKKLGSQNNFKILVMEGFEKLSIDYIESLKYLGNDIIDSSKVYKSYNDKFHQLNRFGDYEKKCFLRWLVIKNILPNEPVIHYDGDIIFNEIPENLEKSLGKYTFVLQGCPALVSINNTDWLTEYQKHLTLFTKDIENYSHKAWKEREGWEQSLEDKWAGSRYREIISSDQDLISHLIHTDRLPQEKPDIIKADLDLLLFENPLYSFAYLKEMLPLAYQRVNNVDHYNGRKVAIWHMQTSFTRYLELVIKRGWLNNVTKCHNPLMKKSFDYKLIRELENAKLIKRLSRLDIYEYFFERNDLSKVFNSRVFWKDNIFI